ncbi:MAG: sigma-54-dependent transcriptional regulator [Caldimicrobium sp.]
MKRIQNFYILIVEDEEVSLKYLSKALELEGYHVEGALTGSQALEKFEKFSYDLIILDLNLPDINGLEVLSRIKSHDPKAEVIIITAYGSIETAVEAIKRGARDYLTKPIELEKLLLQVKNIYEMKALERENLFLKNYQKAYDPTIFIAESPKMKEILKIVEEIKNVDVTILLTGETGTGKSALAKYIHYTGNRKSYPFISINCSVYTEELLASELFGYEKGAFTGATRAKPGLIEIAHGGTLFLDEIAEIPINLQSKFLKVLEEKELFRLGGTKPIKVDVRFIAATNRNLPEEIEAKSFRKDLYYRLSTFEIRLPPLRERKEDIPALTELFLRKYNQRFKKNVKGLTKEAYQILLKYDFPGNVRELENIIERAVLLCKGDYITPELFHWGLQIASLSYFDPNYIKPLDQIVREYVHKILDYYGGNKAKAAKVLGISRTSLWRILKKEEYCS